MHHANNEKQKTTNEKETYKYLLNIESGHYQTCGDERKIKKMNTLGERENYSKPVWFRVVFSFS